MATNYVRTNQPDLVQPGTARLVSIPTDPATQVLIVTSGTRMIFVQNNGPATVAYGDSGVLAVSSGVLFPYSRDIYESVHRDFSQYYIADSVASIISWIEYTD